MTVAAPVVLGPSTKCTDRPFTHPDHVPADRAVLGTLVRDYHHHIRTATSPRQPVFRYVPRAERWYRRIVIPRPDDVMTRDRLAVVGFFGRVRPDVPPELEEQMAAVGKELAESVLVAPGVLGYVTHLLADECNYANLVVLESIEVITDWRGRPLHALAAAYLGPAYYLHVRIYQGHVNTSDLTAENPVQLAQVKYWDYRTEPAWHAIRRLV